MANFFSNITSGFVNQEITTADIFAMLLMVAIISAYQFVVYRFISKRSFYSKSFNISMAVIPFFIATIIMTLQSNMVITLGTIGALAIVRFRTAIKDPMDMVYLFWSVHTGVVCGSGLYKLGIITSLVVTAFILIAEVVPMGKSPYLLVVNADTAADEDAVIKAVSKYSKTRRIKSRTFSKNGLDLIIELTTKAEAQIVDEVSQITGVNNVSLIAHDSEDIL